MIKKIPFSISKDEAVGQIMEFIKGISGLDAVFFATNYLGVFGIESIKDLGWKIGKMWRSSVSTTMTCSVCIPRHHLRGATHP